MRQGRLIPLIVIGAILFIAILILGYLYLTNPSSDRHIQTFIRPTDQIPVHCPEPPSQAFTKDVHVKLEATAEKIIGIVKTKGSGELQFDAEKIVRELPRDVQVFEVIDYRVCAAYGMNFCP